MKRTDFLFRSRYCVMRLVLFVSVFTNAGLCGNATIRVKVCGVERPSAEERLAIFAEAKTDKEAGGLIDALLAKFKKQDFSGIAVTLRNDFLPQKITKRTDKDGVVLFEDLPTVEGNELTAESTVLINGQTVKAKARTFTQSGVVKLKFYTDWVTLKGRVLDPNGKPLGGVHVRVMPMPFEYPFSAFTGMYPPQTAISDSNGVYELPDVRPLEMKTTASYLINSNAAVRSVAYFIGEICAGKTEAAFMQNPCLKLPLISENMVQQARRYNDIRIKRAPESVGKTRLGEQKGIFLPESKGDVIFLPDIIIGDGKPKPADPAGGPPAL